MKKIFTILFLLTLIGLQNNVRAQYIVENDTAICSGNSVTLHSTITNIQSCINITSSMLVVPSEYSTIQAAIDAAVNGDTVLVMSGTFSGTGNRNLQISGKNITLISQCGANSTIIDCGNVTKAIKVTNSVTSITGFTITNGYENAPTDWSGALIIDMGTNASGSSLNSVIVKNCNITSGYITTRGGILSANNVTVENCIFYNNTIAGGSGTAPGTHFTAGGTALIAGGDGIYFKNSIFYNNTLTAHHPALFYTENSTNPIIIENSIIWNNSVNLSYNPSSSTFYINATYSCVSGGFSGTGNISTNPLFTNPTNGDFTLQTTSPCIGTGLNGSNMGFDFPSTLLWSNGATTNSISVQPATTTTYNLSVTTSGVTNTDSVTITVVHPTQSIVDTTITICESYFAGGQLQNISGTYYDTVQNYLGCDSIIITHLNVINPFPYTDTVFVTVYDTVHIAVYDSIAVTDTLIIDVTVGITPPFVENAIKIYPNPANSHITIDYGNYIEMNGYSIKITNSLSQIVFATLINQQQSYIDLSTWSGNGIYFVHLIDGQNNTIDIRKIVLQ